MVFFYSREEINQKQKREQKGLPVNSDDESPVEPWVRGHAHIVFRRGRGESRGYTSIIHMHVDFFYLMISSRTRNQNSYYVDINTWCVVFHIDEHVMCGLSYWWTHACVSFVLALCCNALAFSRNEISKFSKLIFWILLVVYNIKWLISTTCQVVGYFFISISDKVLWLS